MCKAQRPFKPISMMLMSVWLCLLWASKALIFTDASRHCMSHSCTGYGGQTTVIDQKSALICHAAGCTAHESTTVNQTQPFCGSQTVCQSCPRPAGSNVNICYLSRNDPTMTNVMEGSLSASNKISHRTDSDSSPNEAHDDEEDEDEDEESLLQIDTFDMQLEASTSEAEVKSNLSSCSMDAHSIVDVTVRVIVQWYKGPRTSSSKAAEAPHEEESMLDLSPPSDGSIGDTISHWDAHRPSFLEVLPKLANKLKGMFSSNHEDGQDDTSEDEPEQSSGGKKINLIKGGKRLFKYVKNKFKQPLLHVHFSVSDHTITYCRQKQFWKGEMKEKSLLYTAVQNVKVHASQLNAAFMKKAIKLHVTCKNCDTVQYASCVQVLCHKKQTSLRNIGTYHAPMMRNYGILQPGVTMANLVSMPTLAATPEKYPLLEAHPATGVSHMPSMLPATPRIVYNPHTFLAGYGNISQRSDVLHGFRFIGATMALILFTYNL